MHSVSQIVKPKGTFSAGTDLPSGERHYVIIGWEHVELYYIYCKTLCASIPNKHLQIQIMAKNKLENNTDLGNYLYQTN